MLRTLQDHSMFPIRYGRMLKYTITRYYVAGYNGVF